MWLKPNLTMAYINSQLGIAIPLGKAPVKKEKSFTRYFKNCFAEIKNLIFYTVALAR